MSTTHCLWVVFVCLAWLVSGQYLTNKEHSTRAAAEKPNDLRCYTCRTPEDGDSCVDLNTNSTNKSFVQKCKDDRRICMVKRYSYTTSTENTTSTPKLWALERNCSNKCEPGCIIIGERTKLYACTSCCEHSLCNLGTGATDWCQPDRLLPFLAMLVVRL